jgi:soluble lytic murein transglycosylase-like protein
LIRVFLAAGVVFTLAMLLTPEPTLRPVASAVPVDSALRSPALRAPALTIQPAWRPAGAVLNRRTDTPTLSSLPFGLLPHALALRDSQPRESLTRWHRIYTYTAQYRVKPDLARRIYDASVAAGIEPELGFRLVRVESVFDPRAQSPVGALGLTQLMLGTAREFEPGVTREQLLDPDINLRIGFKYLRGLIRDYKGDLKIALLVYNRGPNAVNNAISMGHDPANGYESIVMRGYRGRGTLD